MKADSQAVEVRLHFPFGRIVCYDSGGAWGASGPRKGQKSTLVSRLSICERTFLPELCGRQAH